MSGKLTDLWKSMNRWTWLLLGSGFVLGMFGLAPKPDIDLGIRWSIPALARESYAPAARTDSGSELMFVFVGSSSCPWSNRPELRTLVRTARLAVRDKAIAEDVGFAAVGIAGDAVASNGIAYLAGFGEFDEVMAGRGWLNGGVLRYIYGDLPGPAATPQIVVVERRVVVARGQRSVADERVVARQAGLAEIRRWVDIGMPLELALPEDHPRRGRER